MRSVVIFFEWIGYYSILKISTDQKSGSCGFSWKKADVADSVNLKVHHTWIGGKYVKPDYNILVVFYNMSTIDFQA